MNALTTNNNHARDADSRSGECDTATFATVQAVLAVAEELRQLREELGNLRGDLRGER